MRFCGCTLLLASLLIGFGCDKSPAHAADAPATDGGNAPAKSNTPIKLSQYDKAGYCDLAITPDGTLHAVFNEAPDARKPAYLYYRSSTDGGATWSESKNLSDDESGNTASYARVIVDAKGRIYAVWKYIGKNQILDGPGGTAAGILAIRCLEAGTWSRTAELNDAKAPAYSWFAAAGPGGAIHLVWSAMAADAIAIQGWGAASYADLIQQVVLDGPAAGAPKMVIPRKPLPTKAEVAAAHAASKDIPYEDQRPKQDGLINLRGYIDAAGIPIFIAEDAGTPTDTEHGKHIVLWDGKTRQPLYGYEKYQTYNNFNDPPALLVDVQGKQHVIRAPEKAEKASVRDYAVEGGKWTDPVDIMTSKSGKGTVLHWQAHQLPAGKMAVTIALSEKGGWSADDTELYISFSDGAGKWSAPICITDNAARQNFSHKETGGGNAIASSSTYSPRFASVQMTKDGHPCILMVNSEDTLIGITNTGVTGGGRVVSGTSTGRVDSPKVFFVKR